MTSSAAFARTWLATLIGCVPLLVLLLIPQLMRSRAGSEQGLILGVGLLLALLVAAYVFAPAMSAWLAPTAGWAPRRAMGAARRAWAAAPGSAALALAASFVVYVAGQVIGYALAEAVPYVSANPAYVEGGAASPWVIDYPAYVLQALVLYAFTTLAVALWAWRMRGLHLAARRTTAFTPVAGARQQLRADTRTR
ncbi:hypothetical protein GE115_09075 [Agromyces sp. CFH 90414]|uniref:Uncharacterized protein n=1 Tax=Agromyces agglutinans TaxID=2662258 RepID=A0A6I2F5Z6_9MICO|nr:hypothetical protein [Agromyces agglutinans]MRG60019.1 hypothetical protein [Agromyces agglutinans]